MNHAVLLGDSVFANAAYVGNGPDVVTQLQQQLPRGWRATLTAVDGASIADVPRQLEAMPVDASHLIISAGGNDALGYSGLLGAPSRSVADSLVQLAQVREQFQRDYGGMLQTVLRRGLPFAVCTIYDPRYPDPVQRLIGATALCVINDAIIREAAAANVPLLDLRLICNNDADFANPIEPSTHGGRKIAAAVATLLTQHDFTNRRCVIYVG